MPDLDDTLTRQEVADLLSLTVEEVEIARQAGLLERAGKRRFSRSSVEAFAASAVAQEKLGRAVSKARRERELETTEAAKYLKLPVDRVRQAYTLGVLPVARYEELTYGTLRYFRVEDLEELADFFAVNEARMQVLIRQKRKAAGVKAAETRRVSAGRREAARKAFEGMRPGAGAPLAERLYWYLVLHLEIPLAAGEMDLARDKNFASLRRALVATEYTPRMLSQWQSEAVSLLPEGIGVLAERSASLRALRPASPRDVRGKCVLVGERLLQRDLDAFLSSPPPWWEAAKEKARKRQAEEEERRRIAEERRHPSSAVMGRILDLPVEFLEKEKPKGGWTTHLYDSWTAQKPGWADSEESARAHFDAERAERERVAAKKAERVSAERDQKEARWAEMLGLPLEVVRGKGLRRKNPSNAAKRRLLWQNPAWLQEAWKAARQAAQEEPVPAAVAAGETAGDASV